MSQSTSTPVTRSGTDSRSHRRPSVRGRGDPDPTPTVESETLLSLLGDEYALAILEAIADEPLPARDIVDALDGVSRATVYRRLNSLEEAGLVEAAIAYDPDGNHRKRFRATLDRVTLSLDGDGVTVDGVTRSD